MNRSGSGIQNENVKKMAYSCQPLLNHRLFTADKMKIATQAGAQLENEIVAYKLQKKITAI